MSRRETTPTFRNHFKFCHVSDPSPSLSLALPSSASLAELPFQRIFTVEQIQDKFSVKNLMLKKVFHLNTNVYSWQSSANLKVLAMQLGVLSCICECYAGFDTSTLEKMNTKKQQVINGIWTSAVLDSDLNLLCRTVTGQAKSTSLFLKPFTQKIADFR